MAGAGLPRASISTDPRFLPHTALVIAVGLLAACSFYLTTTLNHDVSWYLIATGRMLDGARLYLDIIEPNPPLVFYLTMPPVAVARLTGVPAESCFITYVLLLAAGSLYLTARVLRVSAQTPIQRSGTLLAALVGLVLLPIVVFGQREHLMLILVLPYVVMFSGRICGDRFSRSLAVCVGMLASLGFGLKPYFLLVPLCFEIYAVILWRSPFAWARPENWGLGAGLLAYGAFVLVVTPEYMRTAVPYALLVYDAYSTSLSAMLNRPKVFIIVAALAIYGTSRALGLVDRRVDAFGVATVAFFACYVIQQKGFAYHRLPATVMVWLATATAFLQIVGTGFASEMRRKLMAIPALASLAVLLIIAFIEGPYRNPLAQRLAPDVERYASAGRIYAFTSHVWVGFPLVNETHVGWSSRLPSQWLLPGAVRHLSDTSTLDPRTETSLREIERYAVDLVIEDLERTPPDLVIVDEQDSHFGPRGFDFLAYFARRPRFALLWQNYVKIKEITVEVGGGQRAFELWCRRDRPETCTG